MKLTRAIFYGQNYNVAHPKAWAIDLQRSGVEGNKPIENYGRSAEVSAHVCVMRISWSSWKLPKLKTPPYAFFIPECESSPSIKAITNTHSYTNELVVDYVVSVFEYR